MADADRIHTMGIMAAILAAGTDATKGGTEYMSADMCGFFADQAGGLLAAAERGAAACEKWLSESPNWKEEQK